MTWQPSPDTSQIETKPDTDADYFFEGVSIKSFDPSGRNINQLNAEKIEHFKSENRSDILNPTLEMTSESGSAWTINADSGKIEHSNNELSLNGEVNISQWTLDRKLEDSTIETSDLLADLNLNQISSNASVSINASGILTTATGLTIDVNKEQLTLNSHVKSKGLENEKK